MGVDAAAGHCGGSHKCQLFTTTAGLLARPGITRTTRAFGSLLRQARNTTRRRGTSVTQLSYWNDNQAAYSWWTVGHDQTVWGLLESRVVPKQAHHLEKNKTTCSLCCF